MRGLASTRQSARDDGWRGRYRPHPGVHVGFVLQQILQGCFAEDAIYRHLQGAPQRADGAVDGTCADRCGPGVRVAEVALEEPAAERVHDVADDNRLRGTRERVSTFFAARSGDEAFLAKNAQQLGGVSLRDAFGLAELRDG